MDSDIKLEKLRGKRQALADSLLEYQEKKKLYTKNIHSINKKMKNTVGKIKQYSYEIGCLKGEYNGENASGKVSDHAIVRYLERYKGINMLDVVNEILEHPDRKYSRDTVTTIYSEDSDDSVKKMIKMVKMRNKKTGVNNG